jgi:acyl phosphate:glycerol-3-phosphate acyltransferase
MLTAALVAIGYVCGSMPWGYWLVRIFRHEDIRTQGSGNIGASNVWRTFGRWYGIPTVAVDALKGFIPALAFAHFVSPLAGVLAGAAAMLGHARPVFLNFERGGKMIATGGGVFLALAPLASLTALAAWLLLLGLFRYASVASMAAAILIPVGAWVYGYPPVVLIFAVVASAGAVLLHRKNVARLLSGTEHRAGPWFANRGRS